MVTVHPLLVEWLYIQVSRPWTISLVNVLNVLEKLSRVIETSFFLTNDHMTFT